MYNLFIYWLIIITFLASNALRAQNADELKDFANKYIKTFEDTLSFKSFKVTLDINDSEIILKKKYGTFMYKFDEYHIDQGEMIIEKNFNNINFQLLNENDSPLFTINYKIKFE